VGDLLQDFRTSVTALGSDWTKYSVVGSFVLYVFGYLAVRFHLTAIGVGTDLAVLDERYLFAGARFVVYLVSSVPSMLLIILPIAFLLWSVRRLRPTIEHAASGSPDGRPVVLAWTGVVLAVIAIQFVMRQCFFRQQPPARQQPAWRAGVAAPPAVQRSADAAVLRLAGGDVRRLAHDSVPDPAR
jgi:hypothetical protein